MSFDFNSASSAEDYGFIRFLPPVLTDTALALRPPLIVPTADDDATEIRINITTDITPDATFELVMDPIAGDRIRGNGTGNLQIKYSTNADLGLYGTYTIREGNYNFSLEQAPSTASCASTAASPRPPSPSTWSSPTPPASWPDRCAPSSAPRT